MPPADGETGVMGEAGAGGCCALPPNFVPQATQNAASGSSGAPHDGQLLEDTSIVAPGDA